MSEKPKTKELVSNRKAHFHYEICETFEAGIVLAGTEVKSLKDHGGSLNEAYIKTKGQELWIVGFSIAPWRFGNIHNHEERREKKLLMHKKEILRLKAAQQQKGLTLIPLSAYLKGRNIKVKIATAKGKTKGDKRATLKEKDVKRQMDRAMKGEK